MAKKRVRKGRKPPPRCKAILLCDNTIVEAETGKIDIIGIFGAWAFPDFPRATPPFKVFLQLTDGIGIYAVSAEVHDLQQDQIIGQVQIGEIDFPERKSRLSLILSIDPLRILHAGSYDFVVLADGHEIDRQQFQVVQIPRGPSHAAEQPQEPEDH